VQLVFVEAPAFTRQRRECLDDDEFARLQVALLAAPDAGAMIPGTGGCRKLRWHDARRNKGKRGGLRVVYYWMPSAKQLWLFAIYAKGEVDDLTIDQRHALKKAIDLELKAMRENM
jgi:hypothetical protein